MTEKAEDQRINELISSLASHEGVVRQRARHELVHLGNIIVPSLVRHLEDKNDRMRWEIAKIFEELKDASAAPAMVTLMGDDVPGVRWLAAEGLIILKEEALVPLLQGVQAHSHSAYFREGVRHVLHAIERDGSASKELLEVLDALEGVAPEESAPFAAKRALDSMIKTHQKVKAG